MAFNAFRDYLSRKHVSYTGNNATYNAEPMISGYFFGAFKIPAEIATFLEDEFAADIVDEVNGDLILSANIRNITPPRTPDIQMVEKPGLGGTGISLPTILTSTRTVDIQFDEYYFAPVTRVIKAWAYAIRDPITGLSRISTITQSKYKGTLDLVYFDPSGNQVLLALRFHGIWPSGAPWDAFTADITASDLILPSVTFNFDVVYHDTSIEADVKEILQREVENLNGLAP